MSARLRAMIDYAMKLTKTPGEMSEADVSALRLAGLDDRAVLERNRSRHPRRAARVYAASVAVRSRC